MILARSARARAATLSTRTTSSTGKVISAAAASARAVSDAARCKACFSRFAGQMPLECAFQGAGPHSYCSVCVGHATNVSIIFYYFKKKQKEIAAILRWTVFFSIFGCRYRQTIEIALFFAFSRQMGWRDHQIRGWGDLAGIEGAFRGRADPELINYQQVVCKKCLITLTLLHHARVHVRIMSGAASMATSAAENRERAAMAGTLSERQWQERYPLRHFQAYPLLAFSSQEKGWRISDTYTYLPFSIASFFLSTEFRHLPWHW
jgi:hypothetical protein